MRKMNFDTITPCGENCEECKKKAEGICQGCLESDGHCKEWEKSRGCPIFLCAKMHGVKFCGVCAEFPCALLLKTVTWRKDVVAELRELAEKYAER